MTRNILTCICMVLSCTMPQTLNAQQSGNNIAVSEANDNYEPVPEYGNMYYPFKENGLWGVKKKEEVVLTTGFQELSGGGFKPIFAYKEEGKWGIVTLHGIMTPPIYDSVKFLKENFSAPKYALYQSGNLYGIINLAGDTITNPIYEIVSGPYQRRVAKDVFVELFFVKEPNEALKIITTSGICLSDGLDLGNKEIPNIDDKMFKTIKKNYKNAVKMAKNDAKIAQKLSQMETIRNKAYRLMEMSEEVNPDIPATEIEIAGFKGKINDLGVIDIPLKYRSDEDILKRDPDNIFALDETINSPYQPSLSVWSNDINEYYQYCRDKLASIQFDIKKYEYLHKLCGDKGYTGSPLEQKYRKYIENLYKAEQEAAKEVAGNAKNEEFNAKLDKIANLATNIINSAQTVVSGSSPQNAVSTGRGSAMSSLPETGSNTSGNIDYKAQYEKWESLAKRHYNSLTNTGYKVKKNGKDTGGGNGQSLNGGNYVMQKKSLREAQNQMKRIRQKAAKAGVSIPKSEYETVTVSY